MNGTGNMVIVKVLNNNVAVTLDAHSREQVVMGKGLAFGKKPGDVLASDNIEKVFVMQEDGLIARLTELTGRVSLEVILTADRIISLAQQRLGTLQESLCITLTDHLQFAVTRHTQGIVLHNTHLWEARHLYPKEFMVSLEALDIIEERLNVRFPEDEAGFITLHLVTAQLNNAVSDVPEMSRMMQEILHIIVYFLHLEIDETSLNYQRLITHLKFFAWRMLTKTQVPDDDTVLHDAVRCHYPLAWHCVEKISSHLSRCWQRPLTTEEMMFLAIHIERIRKDKER